MEEKKELQNQDERVVEIELERLRGFVNHSKEQWDEKITDSINYFLILCAIVKEELNEEN
ncbi:hypothetical protein [Agathobacter rectalis]|uniref:hypothetical protein n=1 Tax=Agathobacter rectalis TaxID=39491 RepID=UPI0026D6D10A|nr:hypothetical protein [Agathobacter rectalis]